MIPTPEQMLTCIRMCQTLSNFYTDIYLFRYDEKRKEIYILAGETLSFIILTNGNVEFEDESST